MPLLQACRRAWADPAPAAWSRGYCPTCGAWPALAGIRGTPGPRLSVSGLWRGLSKSVAPLPLLRRARPHAARLPGGVGGPRAREDRGLRRLPRIPQDHHDLRADASRAKGAARPRHHSATACWPRWTRVPAPEPPEPTGGPDRRRALRTLPRGLTASAGGGLRSPRNRSWRHRGWSPVAPLQRGEVFAWAGEGSRRAAAERPRAGRAAHCCPSQSTQ